MLSRTRQWLGRYLSRAAGRTVRIHGNVSISWRQSADAGEPGWRAPLPSLCVTLRDISIANPAWMRIGSMARIGETRVAVRLLPLLRGTLDLRSVALSGLRLDLERDRNGCANWSQNKDRRRARWRVRVSELSIRRGEIRFVNAARNIDCLWSIGETHGGAEMRWILNGSYDGHQVVGQCLIGMPEHLPAQRVRYPLRMELHHGAAGIHADGVWIDPLHASKLDLRMRMAGASMAQLYPLTGLPLPETPDFVFEGKAWGSIRRGTIRLRYQEFNGTVGASDINGTLEYLHRQPRPLLRGTDGHRLASAAPRNAIAWHRRHNFS